MTHPSDPRVWSRRFSAFLGAIGILFLALSLLMMYVGRVLLREESFTDRVTASLDDPAVGEFVALRLTDVIIAQKPDLTALRPILVVVTRGVVTSTPFRALVRPTARRAHQALLSGTTENILLSVPDARILVHNALETAGGAAAERLPARLGPVLQLKAAAPALRAVGLGLRIAHAVRSVGRAGLLVAVLCFIVAIAVAPLRRQTMLSIGVGVATVGALLVVTVPAGRVLAAAAIPDPAAAAAAAGLWRAFTAPLRTVGGVVGSLGVVLAMVAVPYQGIDWRAVGRRVWAMATERRHRPLAELGRLATIGIAGLVAALSPSAALSAVAVVGGLVLIILCLAGLRQLVQPYLPAGMRGTSGEVRPGPLALAGVRVVVLVALGVGAASALLRLRPPPQVFAATGACNGAVELCARPFNRVVFPGAHNAMGAATDAHWLFPNQDLDIRRALDHGIRAFLLDPYRGNVMGDRVRTDFDAVPHANRKIEEVIGQEAWNAGMRIRERLTGEPGPSGVYLCHGFCEMGAIPFEDALRIFVEFLVTHPEEVVILSFEDYVPPADIATAFEASGLIDFVYRGPLGPTWPTLGEMVASGGRVVVLGDTDVGDIPWYHHSMSGLVAETWYTFRTPEEFNCRPNRGTPSGELFLINHWIETTPTPRPSNAEIVNQRDVIVRRARQCERERGMTPSILAVDFAGIGDVVGAARELNRLPPIAKR
jgi:hypothetical protein